MNIELVGVNVANGQRLKTASLDLLVGGQPKRIFAHGADIREIINSLNGQLGIAPNTPYVSTETLSRGDGIQTVAHVAVPNGGNPHTGSAYGPNEYEAALYAYLSAMLPTVTAANLPAERSNGASDLYMDLVFVGP